MRKLADILLLTEPVWVLPILVYSYLLIAAFVPGPYFLVWVGLSIACIPFILRKLRWGYFSVRSALEIPAVIFLVGAVIGLVVSIDFSLSIRTFQSLLACVLCYYSFVNYKRPRTLIISFSLLFFTFWIIGPLSSFLRTITFPLTSLEASWINTITKLLPQIFNLSIGGESVITYNAVYSVGLPIVVLVAILIGVIVFSNKWLLRAISLVICVVLIFTLFVASRPGLGRLIDGISVESRIDLWRDMIYMIKQNPITGLGLGMPLLFTYGIFASTFTHPHNSYLELYANTGIVGAIAVAVSVIIVAKIAIDIIRSEKSNRWYCFGIGLIIAVLLVAGLGVVLTSLSGHLVRHDDGYYYGISVVPWILGAVLVMTLRILTKSED